MVVLKDLVPTMSFLSGRIHNPLCSNALSPSGSVMITINNQALKVKLNCLTTFFNAFAVSFLSYGNIL